MIKLSKTAEAAKKAVEKSQQKTAKVEMTLEEMIRQIRLNLDAHLAIPSHFVKALLDAYDLSIVERDRNSALMGNASDSTISDLFGFNVKTSI